MYSDTVNGLVDRPPLELPEPVGAIVHLQEKLFVPVKEYPDVSANNTSAALYNYCYLLPFYFLLSFSKTHHYCISCHRHAKTFEWWSPVAFRASRMSVLTRLLCIRTSLGLRKSHLSFQMMDQCWRHERLLVGYPYIHVCVHYIKSPVVCVSVGLWPLSQSVTFLMVISEQAHERLCHVLSSNISLHNPSCLEWGNEWGEGNAG